MAESNSEKALRILNEHLPPEYKAMPNQTNYAIVIYHKDDFPLMGVEPFYAVSETEMLFAINPAHIVGHAVRKLDRQRETQC